MKKLIGLFIFTISLDGHSHFSVEEHEMQNFYRQCVRRESDEVLVAGLNSSFETQRNQPFSPHPIFAQDTQYANLFQFYENLPENIDQVEIDGFRMERPSLFDLEMVLRLTEIDEAEISWDPDNNFSLEYTVSNGVLSIRRSCRPGHRYRDCPENQTSARPAYQLARFNRGAEPCSDAICAAQRIFGASATEILTNQSRYQLNTSPYRDPDVADSNGLSAPTSMALRNAARALPVHLYPQALHFEQFFAMEPGQGRPGLIANASGRVFDEIESYSPPRRIQVFYHELGHRAHGFGDDNHTRSEEWLSISGFEQIGEDSFLPDYRTVEGRSSVSPYGNTNPNEDFAEAFTMYRFAPQRLQEISPERYRYLRDNIYNGLEYTTDICNGTRLPIPQSDNPSRDETQVVF